MLTNSISNYNVTAHITKQMRLPHLAKRNLISRTEIIQQPSREYGNAIDRRLPRHCRLEIHSNNQYSSRSATTVRSVTDSKLHKLDIHVTGLLLTTRSEIPTALMIRSQTRFQSRIQTATIVIPSRRIAENVTIMKK